MKKYINYYYKKILTTSSFIIVIGLLTIVLPSILFNANRPGYQSNQPTFLGIFALFFGIMTPLLSFYEFYVLKTKKGVDFYYALPLDKKELNRHIFFKGLITLLIAFTVLYLLIIFVPLIKGYSLRYIYYIPQFFHYIVVLTLFYGFSSFVFTRANTTIDGIMFFLMSLFFVLIIYNSLNVILEEFTDFSLVYKNNINYVPFFPLYHIDFTYTHVIEKRATWQNGIRRERDFVFFTSELGFSGFWLAISSLLTYFLLFDTHFEKPENVGQISESYFGYKLMLPISTFLLSLSAIIVSSNPNVSIFATNLEIFIFLFVIMAASLILSVIYRRGFKYKSLSIILSITLPIFALLFYTILKVIL